MCPNQKFYYLGIVLKMIELISYFNNNPFTSDDTHPV